MKQNSKSRFYVFCATALALLILVGAFASDVVNIKFNKYIYVDIKEYVVF